MDLVRHTNIVVRNTVAFGSQKSTRCIQSVKVEITEVQTDSQWSASQVVTNRINDVPNRDCGSHFECSAL